MDHRVARSLVDGHTLAGQNSVCPPPTVSSNRQKPSEFQTRQETRGKTDTTPLRQNSPQRHLPSLSTWEETSLISGGPVGLISGLSARALSTLDTTDILLLQVLLYVLVGSMNLPKKRAGA